MAFLVRHGERIFTRSKKCINLPYVVQNQTQTTETDVRQYLKKRLVSERCTCFQVPPKATITTIKTRFEISFFLFTCHLSYRPLSCLNWRHCGTTIFKQKPIYFMRFLSLTYKQTHHTNMKWWCNSVGVPQQYRLQLGGPEAGSCLHGSCVLRSRLTLERLDYARLWEVPSRPNILWIGPAEVVAGKRKFHFVRVHNWTHVRAWRSYLVWAALLVSV